MQHFPSLFVVSFCVSSVQSGSSAKIVPVGLAMKLDCLASVDEETLQCPSNTTYKWFRNTYPLSDVNENLKWNSLYDIDTTTGALTYFYVGTELNETVFACTATDASGDICASNRIRINVDVCRSRTRGGVKSLCKFGQCYLDERANRKYFRCRCFRYYFGFYCDKFMKKDAKDFVVTWLPWLPVVLIVALTIGGWVFVTFFTGHSKKECVFAKHK